MRPVRGLLRVALGLLAVLALGACRDAEVLTFEEAAAGLGELRDQLKSPPSDPASRLQLAQRIVRAAHQRAELLRRTGHTYVHAPMPPPGEVCLEDAACSGRYLRFQLEAQQREAGPSAAAPPPAALTPERLRAIAAVIGLPAFQRRSARAARRFVRGVVRAPVTWQGQANAPTRVWLPSTGHPAEALRDASLRALLGRHPRAARYAVVRAQDHPQLFAEVGAHLSAAVVLRGRVFKDVVREDQWQEFLLATPPAPSGPPRGAALIDAHAHLGDDDGAARLIEAMDRAGVTHAVLAALVVDVQYTDLATANRRVLEAARRWKGRFVPLVMLSPAAANPLAELQAAVRDGARGVKLISGHGDFFEAHRARPGTEVLDSPRMREVFAYCQERRLPVLWHVNAHLYGQGFLRVLRDFPRLTVVNPHLGGYLSFAPAALRAALERYPNLMIDLSLGGEAMYVRRSLEDLAFEAPAWRQLLFDHADRFLFGADLVMERRTSAAYAASTYQLLRGVLEGETFDLHHVPARGFSLLREDSHHRPGLRGLALPAPVLRAIYADNARRVFGPP
jgi:predicted TIM-barrel fold metal-dependent hydrolase